MIRLGIIGTNQISHRFMGAVREIPDLHLNAVYSRSACTGEQFARKYGCSIVYTSLKELAESGQVDAVYIASPNSCHAEQAVMMLRAGKHVLCEKPVAASLEETEQMIKAARENHVVLLEAMRSVHDPGFLKLQELIPMVGTVRRVTFTYCQYSSRYDRFKQDEVLNAFNPELANAALMDIGVYCVHPLVSLWGMPENIVCASLFLSNGMEGMGSVIASYPDMLAELQYSKITDGALPSQIQGENGVILIDKITDIRKLELILRDGTGRQIEIPKKENNMYYEAEVFVKLILGKLDDAILRLYDRRTLWEMELMDKIRSKAGIRFKK